MTRRAFLFATLAASQRETQSTLVVPVRRVLDARGLSAAQLHRFWWTIWPETARTFARGGIRLQCSDTRAEIHRTAGGRPVFFGVDPGAINLVLADHIPPDWDEARALAGITTLYDGYCICLIAIPFAHGNRVPFLSVNTCVHEMLHALLGDIFVKDPGWFQSGLRESRIDWYATRLWLWGSGADVRQAGRDTLRRLSAAAAARVAR